MKADWKNKIKPGHHAYLITGTEETLPELVEYLKKDWKVDVKGNPDFVIHNYPILYIDDCHKLSEESSTKPMGDGDRIFLVYFGFMTRESANSLLKLFEEPTPRTIFFVVTPNPERLPATLRSRFLEIKVSRLAVGGTREEAEKFLKMDIGQRFEYSKKLAGDISDEKRTRSDALLILEALEEITALKFGINSKTVSAFKEFEKCRSYLKDQSSSVKMLFDSMAMVIAEIDKQ